MLNTQVLKARVDFNSLVQETHPVTKSSKTICLWHDDTNPSLHIYPDGYFCFSCGASGDHLDWLTTTRALSFQDAVDVLTQYASLSSTATYPVPEFGSNSTPSKTFEHTEKPTSEWRSPLNHNQLETHQRRATKLKEVPDALADRGFTLTDCKRLSIVNENGNAIFPVTGPNGSILALKCRYAAPNPYRYEYITPGRGAPAWCSPDIHDASTILVIEGELNGMVCWLAVADQNKQLGVMGAAGSHGVLHPNVLKNKIVYVHADGDEAGQNARRAWAEQALRVGAKEVYVLEPWPIDACEVAGAFGKAALRKRLRWGEKRRFVSDREISSQAFSATGLASAIPPAPKPFPIPTQKPDLVQWCSHSRGLESSNPQRLQRSYPPTLTPKRHHDAA